ncbi:MAG: hypothetical protein KAU47_08825 [Candidatus Aminicenantes bacterium]|nr:hypothetical protein [Candidatus Aminicenantes bacterium]
MKRIYSISFLGIFLLTLMTYPGYGQSIKRILKRMIDAQGGPKVFESVKDMTMTGVVEMVQQGISGTLTMYKKEPDKRRVDLEAMGRVIIQAYDGQTVWWTNPQSGNTEEMSEQDAASMKRQSLPIVAILDPEKYGITFAYKGKEKIEGRDYHVLEQSHTDGYKMLRYVDAETYLTGRSKSTRTGPGGIEIQVEQIMSDFKTVGGRTMAHSIVTYYNGEVFTKIAVEKVGFNSGLEDSLFKMDK